LQPVDRERIIPWVYDASIHAIALGVEAFYTDAGKYQSDDVGGSISGKTHVQGVAAVGTLPLSDAFSLYAKLGYAQAKASVTGVPTGGAAIPLDGTRSAATYGLGGVYSVSPALGIRFGWDRYAAAALDPAGVSVVTTNYNVDVYSLGAVFKF
jgi:OOP family OmpA-OmpF porin